MCHSSHGQVIKFNKSHSYFEEVLCLKPQRGKLLNLIDPKQRQALCYRWNVGQYSLLIRPWLVGLFLQSVSWNSPCFLARRAVFRHEPMMSWSDHRGPRFRADLDLSWRRVLSYWCWGPRKRFPFWLDEWGELARPTELTELGYMIFTVTL